nr:ribonuclease H-like domain-containing protein [Tanacetum cinerariifolium]
LSHFNFDYINLLSKKDIVIVLPKLKYVKDQLCSSCDLSKAKRSSFKSKAVSSSKGRLNLLHMDLCGPIRVASINGKKYILGNNLLTGNRGSDLYTISLQESTSSTPLCLMAKAIPTQAWLWHRRLSYLNFDYINLLSKKDIVIGLSKLKDDKNLDKIKEKGDPCILVGYSTQSKGYRVYNKRTRMIFESIHIRFDEIKEVSDMFVANDTSGLVPQQQKALDYDNPDPVPNDKIFIL